MPRARAWLIDPRGGHGLVGMHERMTLYGGDVEAGPARGGGFAVRAALTCPPNPARTPSRS